MTKAEEAAMKAYPVQMQPLNYQDLIEQFGGKTEIDVHTYPRTIYQEGYEQAEKDLGWISVKDRLPDKNDIVITCWDVNGCPQGIGLRLYDGQWQPFDDDDIESADPDYWMYIPQFKEAKK